MAKLKDYSARELIEGGAKLGFNVTNTKLEIFPSCVYLQQEDIGISIDINLLGAMVRDWRKENPDLDFERYTYDPSTN